MGSHTASLALLLLAPLVQDDAAAEEAIKRFNTAVRNPSPTARATAVSELARVPHERTMKVLIPLLTADVAEVRIAAAKGLGTFADYKKVVTPMMIAAFSSPANAKEIKVRSEILGGLAALKDPLACDTIHRAFRDECASVAKAAIGATGTMRVKESMDALLDLQKDIQKWIKQKQSGGYRDDKGQLGDENQQKGRLEDIQNTIVKAFQAITKEK
jgi:HEAT repeat protein